MSIEDKYNRDFPGGDGYESAIQKLWEDHCKYPQRQSWPPSLEDVKKEIESEQWRDVADRR